MDPSLIKHKYLSIRGFDNVAREFLGTITFPIKVGPVILPTPIQVMLNSITYNLLLGKPRIHAMQVVPSTLHYSIKFIYNNKMYTSYADTNLQACLKTSSDSKSSLTSSNSSLTKVETPSPPKYTSSSKEALLDNDLGSLYFTPTFIGEYKIPQK